MLYNNNTPEKSRMAIKSSTYVYCFIIFDTNQGKFARDHLLDLHLKKSKIIFPRQYVPVWVVFSVFVLMMSNGLMVKFINSCGYIVQ